VAHAEWTVHEFAAADSTSMVAAHLPVWHAVRADVQTSGRGRFERAWVSDAGGLWLSAVVPARSRGAGSEQFCLPLIAGLAVCDMLRDLSVAGVRMRWPNDILVQDRKLAGLLLDQFAADQVVVGIGINVSNQPEECDATLKDQTARLMDLVEAPPELDELTALVLGNLRRVVLEWSDRGFASVLPRINALWGPPRRVKLEVGTAIHRGVFERVDAGGRLLLQEEGGSVTAYEAHDVRHLREI